MYKRLKLKKKKTTFYRENAYKNEKWGLSPFLIKLLKDM